MNFDETQNLIDAYTEKTKICLVKQTNRKTTAFYKAKPEGKLKTLCYADTPGNCTHELRKLFWALGEYFKIQDSYDVEEKLERVRNFVNQSDKVKFLNGYTKDDIKEIIHIITGQEIDL